MLPHNEARPIFDGEHLRDDYQHPGRDRNRELRSRETKGMAAGRMTRGKSNIGGEMPSIPRAAHELILGCRRLLRQYFTPIGKKRAECNPEKADPFANPRISRRMGPLQGLEKIGRKI